MMFNRAFNRKKQDLDDVRQELDGSDELLIEEIIYDDKENYGKVRRITTNFLRNKFGDDKVDRALWRIAKRKPREQVQEDDNKFNLREFLEKEVQKHFDQNSV